MNDSIMPEDTLIPAKNPLEGATVPLLPPVALDAMNQNQLKEFVPELIEKITGRPSSSNHKDSESRPPNWWPPEIPWVGYRANDNMWAESLRSLVRSFYRYLGQENRVTGGIPSNGTQRYNLYPQYGYSKSPSQIYARSKYAAPLDLVDLGAFPSDILYNSCTKNDVPPTFLEVYICYFCEQEFKQKEEMQRHQSKCERRPPLLKAINASPSRKIFPHTDIPFRIEKPTRPPKDSFLKIFDLIPKESARRIRNRLRSSIDVQCDHIDVTIDNPVSSPVTPKTPKLLISQLSYDTDKSSEVKTRDNEYDSDVESVLSSQSSEFDVGEKKRLSLLNIEVSSLLGKRIHQHVKSDSNIPVILQPESFCRTPSKNRFVDKLRTRNSDFPVTYRSIKRLTSPYCHQYKFSKTQREEFMEMMKTGLNRASRHLLRSLPTCKVVVHRLSKQTVRTHTRSLQVAVKQLSNKEIIQWTSPKHSQSSNFPATPILKSNGIDQVLGLKRKSGNGGTSSIKRQLSLVNVVSEEVNAEVAKQKLAVYKTLLSDMSDGKSLSSCAQSTYNSLRSFLTANRVDHPMGTALGSSSGGSLNVSPSSLNSSPKSIDDQLSIRTISSDDESIRSGCCLMCQAKKRCGCTSPPIRDIKSLKQVIKVKKENKSVHIKKVQKNLDQIKNSTAIQVKKSMKPNKTMAAEKKSSPKSPKNVAKSGVNGVKSGKKTKNVCENVDISKSNSNKKSPKAVTPSKSVKSKVILKKTSPGPTKKTGKDKSSPKKNKNSSPKSKPSAGPNFKARSPLSSNYSLENGMKKQSCMTKDKCKTPKSKTTNIKKEQSDCSANKRSPIKITLKINSDGHAEKIKHARTMSMSDVQMSPQNNLSKASPKKKKRSSSLDKSQEPSRKKQKCS